jgi:hypothetical protein
MLAKILKLVGVDLQAQIEAAKANVKHAVDQVKEVGEQAAVIAALSIAAIVVCAMAAVVGIIALYRVTADVYGAYVGLAVVGGFLVAVAAILLAVITTKAKSLSASYRPSFVRETTPRNPRNDQPSVDRRLSSHSESGPSSTTMAAASVSDLLEPLAFFISKHMNFPKVGNPIIDEIVGSLRANAQPAADEALERAAGVIRYGSRSDIVAVLTSTVLLAWLITRSSRAS